MFQWKNLFINIFLLKWKHGKLIKHLWKWKKMGKHIQDAELLVEELKMNLCLCEKENKGYKERRRPEGRCWECNWAVFNSIFMNYKGTSHTLKGRTFFFITFAEEFIIQITWNSILHHWHAFPARNYGKLLALFFS